MKVSEQKSNDDQKMIQDNSTRFLISKVGCLLAPGTTACSKTLDLLKSSTEPPVVDGPPDLPAAVVAGQRPLKNQRLQLQGFALEKIKRQ